MPPETESSPSSEEGGQVHTVHHRVVERLRGGALGLTPTLAELVGWNYNAVLTGVSLRSNGRIWTAVIKADFDDGPKVSFLDVGTFGRTCDVLVEFADAGLLKWVHDKYPPKFERSRPSDRFISR